jgi:hypothetical protein
MSTELRTAIYGLMAAVLALLSVVGWINAETATEVLAAGAETLTAAGAIMAMVKTWRQRGAKAVLTVENAAALAEALRDMQRRGLM